MNPEFIGLAAGTLTTAAFVPQAWKVWSSRSTTSISLLMYLVFALGLVLWIVYGWSLGSLSIVLANTITLALAVFILGMKLRHG